MSLTKGSLNAIYVVLITSAFYVGSFSGIPYTSDEDLFLSAAQNIFNSGRIDAPAVYGSLRLQGDYHGVEPAHPVLASFWYRFILTILPAGRLQGLYLLPILYTSLTCGLIVILAIQLNYTTRTGVAAGVLFGLSTMAWPYAKTFYRETLISFLMLFAWVIFEKILRNRSFWVKSSLAGVCLFLLALILLTKVVLVFFVISFIIMLLVRTNDIGIRNIRSIFTLTAIVLVIAVFIIINLFNVSVEGEVFYRFTSTFIKDAIGRYRFIDHGHFWEAVISSLISPWKGFFFYSPICFVAFLSIFKLYNKKQMYLILVPLITLTGLVVMQALAYDDEWWTTSWSVRYLLPCVPLFVVAGLPWIEEALQSPRSFSGIGLVIFFAFGTFIQLGAVIFNPSEYNWRLFEKVQTFSTEVVWSFSNAPLWGQWGLFAQGVMPDLAIMRSFENVVSSVLVLLVVALLLIWLLFYFWINLDTDRKGVNYDRIILSFTCVALSTLVFVAIYNNDAYYHLQSSQVEGMCNELKNRVSVNDIVLIKPYRSKIWFYFMNSDCLKYEWYSLPYNIELINDPEARDLVARFFNEKAGSPDHVWLVNQVWSEPDKLNEMLQEIGFNLIESHRYPLDDTTIFFDLYKKYNQ